MFRKKNKMEQVPLWFLLPSFLGITLFVLIPFIDVVRRSFLTSVGNVFVGTNNYRAVLQNKAFRLALANTLKLMVACLPLIVVLSLFLGLIIYHSMDKASFLKTTFLLPMAIPVASIVFLWRGLFDAKGLINGLLVQLGSEPVAWMTRDTAFWIVVFSFIWKNLGYSIVIWIAGRAVLQESMYESATIDGAGAMQSFVYITLPGLMPSLFTILVLCLVYFFKIFREAWLVAGDYPHESIYLIQHLFNNWFRELSIDKLTAAAVIVLAVFMLFILLLRKVWDKNE